MKLISPKQAAEQIGVSVATVKVWIRRAENPLPAVAVGTSGTHYRVVADAITDWLADEASRKAQGAVRGNE